MSPSTTVSCLLTTAGLAVLGGMPTATEALRVLTPSEGMTVVADRWVNLKPNAQNVAEWCVWCLLFGLTRLHNSSNTADYVPICCDTVCCTTIDCHACSFVL